MDADDPVLCKALAYRIVQALRLQWKMGKVKGDGMRKNVRLWSIPAGPALPKS
ncbi:MAG: hypothetical protein INR62_12790 [Rhodospirillales bacterium]|nr:hypothetical protein [Acetobacter sp.]